MTDDPTLSGRVLFLLLLMLLSVPLTLFPVDAVAQSFIVKGSVLDNNTRQPLPDVHLLLQGTDKGTSSDRTGSFSIRIDGDEREKNVVFTHVSYENREISVLELRKSNVVLLMPRIIPLQSTEVTGSRQQPHTAARDLPQTVSVLESRDFEIRGYVDAGDLLRTDHSIQVNESISGKKTISIRGGNADDVIILLNGIKLNSNFDNEYDISLIELSDIERFEIVKGSNTSLYGSEAFSGVINILPKAERGYNIRLHQQIGSYDMGQWGMQLFHNIGAVSGNYSFRRGGMKRGFTDVENARLVNSTMNHSAGFRFETGNHGSGNPDLLTAQWRYDSRDFDNERDFETLSDMNNILGLRYQGSIASIDDLTLALSWTRLDQQLSLFSQNIDIHRRVDDEGLQARVEKFWQTDMTELVIAYQFGFSGLTLEDKRINPLQQPVGLEYSELTRQRHGLVGVGKLHGETGSDFLRTFDVDVSLRHDRVRDRQNEAVQKDPEMEAGDFGSNDWSETLFKFAVNLRGIEEDFLLDVFLSYGNNVKFPTLFQQISSPLQVSEPPGYAALESVHTKLVPTNSGLQPESNRSVEIGAALTRELRNPDVITGWEITAAFFQNHYNNKFRRISTPGIPLTFYDNVDNASISGLESKAGLYVFDKKILLEVGLSHYFISELSAFPFKSEVKRTVSLSLDHAGNAFQLFYFYEGKQEGLLRYQNGEFGLVEMPEFSNLDVHASKYFQLGNIRFFLNISLRNILYDEKVIVHGLSIRDRRYYLTAGVQY